MESLKDKYNYCAKPWTDMHIFEDGSVSPCCLIPDKDFYKGPLKDYFLKSESLLILKNTFKNNLKSPHCKVCWQLEDLGLPSKRVIFSPKKLHIRVSNKCNFKCRMCSNNLSSAWQKEHEVTNIFKQDIKTYDNIFDNKDNLLFLYEKIKEDNPVKINITGGEPLISNSHLRLLIFLIKSNKMNIKLQYSTNLSTLKYKGVYFPNLWKLFNEVTLIVSCDGYGISNNYSRKGFYWDNFNNNLKELVLIKKKNKYLKLRIHCTINLYSIYSIPELCVYAEDNDLEIVLGYCFDPKILNPQILPLEEKNKIRDKYVKFNHLNSNNKNILKNTLNFLFENTEETKAKNNRDIFINWNKKVDDYRKENFLDYNPELKNWYEWNYE
jgi:MoaA/NifB/PqqE/SkfB family radical SAM enzyme